MKVWHIINPGKSGVNGVTNVVLSLSKSQQSLGIHSTIILEKKHPALTGNKDIITITTASVFKGQLQQELPQLVVFHSLYSKTHIAFAKILKRYNIPYIIVFHGGASKDNYQKNHLKKYIANKLFFNNFIRCASKVVYLNEGEHSKSIFNQINPNYWIIPNGISSCNTGFDKRSTDKLNIIYLGRMDWHGKGLDILVQAIRILYNSEYRHKLNISLYGFAYDDTIKVWEEFGDFAKYYGPVYGNEKHNILKNGHIMVLPSRSEGMPLTILEALSFGIPSIVTPETNMAELLTTNNAGWETSLNYIDLANVIKQAYNNYISNPNTYIQSCLHLATTFDWNIIASKTIDLYLSIIK